MASLSLKNIYKVYPNGVKAVSDFNMEIADKEFIVFVGPSGCGKSTTLRMIAGLEEISAGELKIGDRVVNDADCKERDTSMVFQNYALYPHFTVYENIAFPLKMMKASKEEIKEKVLKVAKILGLEDYLGKKPSAMSGGQRQRVALGRAIVREPKVFLLDEPLSNLDAKLRTQMRSEITKLHQRLQTTFIYVTHDQTEAMTMGDRIVVMKDGFVQQIDSPVNLYNYPVNKFVAGFIGTPPMNFYDAQFIARDEQFAEICFANDQHAKIPLSELRKLKPDYLNGKPFILGMRPENLIPVISEDGEDAIECVVNQVELLGSETLLYCDFDKEGNSVYIESKNGVVIKADGMLNLPSGTVIKVRLNPAGLHYFDRETEENVAKRLPDLNEIEVKVVNGNLHIGDQSCPIPPAVSLQDGVYTAVIPVGAWREDEGGAFRFRVFETENAGNRFLIRLEGGHGSIFMLSDEKIGGEAQVSLLWKEATFTQAGKTVREALPNRNNLDGILRKVRTKKDKMRSKNIGFDIEFVAQDAVFRCPTELNTRILGSSDRKIFNVPMRFSFDESALIDGDKLQGKVIGLLDYGNEKFVQAEINGNLFVLPSRYARENKVMFDLNPEKVSVIDLTLNIIIA